MPDTDNNIGINTSSYNTTSGSGSQSGSSGGGTWWNSLIGTLPALTGSVLGGVAAINNSKANQTAANNGLFFTNYGATSNFPGQYGGRGGGNTWLLIIAILVIGGIAFFAFKKK